MTTPQFEVRLLVNGREIPKYKHETGTFVCGFEKQDFEIELVNHTDKIVLMIPSVDGLSVTDGKEASEDSQGYLVRPKSSVKIPGWTLDNDAVAKFVFAEKKKSYAATHEDHASTDNVGVIGCLVYSRKVNEGEKIDELLKKIEEMEKQRPIIINPIYPWYYWDDYYWRNRPYLPPYNGYPYYLNTYTVAGTAPTYGSSSLGANSINMVNCSNTMASSSNDSPMSCPSVFSAKSIGSAESSNNCFSPESTATFGQFSIDTSGSLSMNLDSVASSEEDFSLGVGFGESTVFKTNNVTFEREALLETIVIYYDTRKNLEKRGIIITKPIETKKTPNPFPKMGCKPPKGWAEKA